MQLATVIILKLLLVFYAAVHSQAPTASISTYVNGEKATISALDYEVYTRQKHQILFCSFHHVIDQNRFTNRTQPKRLGSLKGFLTRGRIPA